MMKRNKNRKGVVAGVRCEELDGFREVCVCVKWCFCRRKTPPGYDMPVVAYYSICGMWSQKCNGYRFGHHFGRVLNRRVSQQGMRQLKSIPFLFNAMCICFVSLQLPDSVYVYKPTKKKPEKVHFVSHIHSIYYIVYINLPVVSANMQILGATRERVHIFMERQTHSAAATSPLQFSPFSIRLQCWEKATMTTTTTKTRSRVLFDTLTQNCPQNSSRNVVIKFRQNQSSQASQQHIFATHKPPNQPVIV